MYITENIQRLREPIDSKQLIPVQDLMNAGFASRSTIWRKVRAGMPVAGICERLFVRFSDLVNANSRESEP